MKLDDAFEFVKTQREATDPNDGFMEQLRQFEATQFSFEDSESGASQAGDHDHATCARGHPMYTHNAVSKSQSMPVNPMAMTDSSQVWKGPTIKKADSENNLISD